MPCNCLSLPIRVGCENNRVCFFDRFDDVLESFFAARAEFPGHCKIFVRQNRTVFAGQVSDMSETRQNLIIFTQIFIDCFGFCRRFYNN